MTMILGRAVATETTRWDPAGTNQINFSFNNLLARMMAGTNIYRAVRSTTAKSTGRWYFELWMNDNINLTGSWVGGVGLGTTNLMVRLGSDTDGSIGFSAEPAASSTAVWANGDHSTSYFTFNWSIGDQFGYAVDLIDHAMWGRSVSGGLDWTRSTFPWGLLADAPADPSTGFGVPASVPIYIMWSGFKPAAPVVTSVVLVTAPGSLSRGSPPENFFWWDHGPHHS